MGKGKLKKFKQNAKYNHVFEPEVSEFVSVDHSIKGKWNTNFFNNDRPIVIELGCGKGEYSVGLARLFPDKNFVGVDIKGARIWKGATESEKEQLKNVAFLRTRIELINSFFVQDEVDEIWITFPDPQMKKRRAKKRLTSSIFLTYYQKLLKDKGIINLKTDSTFLYEYTLEVIKLNKLEIIKNTDNLYAENWTDEILGIQTHYERLHIDDGDNINYVSFILPKNQRLVEPSIPEDEQA